MALSVKSLKIIIAGFTAKISGLSETLSYEAQQLESTFMRPLKETESFGYQRDFMRYDLSNEIASELTEYDAFEPIHQNALNTP